MLFKQALIAGLLSAVAEANNAARDGFTSDFALGSRADTCPSVRLIVARGSDEAPGTGIIGSVARDIASDNPGSQIEPVQYVATLTNYANSSYNGTLSVIQDLEQSVKECPKTKIVLMGYSQGAHVIGDALCGGGGVGVGGEPSPYNDPVPKNVADQVVAVIQMGDPRFVANLTFDRGTSKNNGIFSRPANLSCEDYASKIRSYCNMNDPFCSGGSNLTVHVLYTFEFGPDARKFVDSKLGTTPGSHYSDGDGPGNSTGSSSGSTGGSSGNSTGGSSGNSTGGSQPSGTGAPRPSGTGSGSSPSVPASNWATRVASPVSLGVSAASLLLLAAFL